MHGIPEFQGRAICEVDCQIAFANDIARFIISQIHLSYISFHIILKDFVTESGMKGGTQINNPWFATTSQGENRASDHHCPWHMLNSSLCFCHLHPSSACSPFENALSHCTAKIWHSLILICFSQIWTWICCSFFFSLFINLSLLSTFRELPDISAAPHNFLRASSLRTPIALLNF